MRDYSKNFEGKKVIFLFEVEDLVAKPWLDAGYEVWLLDESFEPGITRKDNLIKLKYKVEPANLENQARMISLLVGLNVVLVGSNPDASDLASSGARWFASKAAANPSFQDEAVAIARFAETLGNLYKCPWYICNPVSKLSTLWRKPDYKFNPSDFSGYLPADDTHPIYPEIIPARDAYNKRSNLWYGNGFKEPKKINAISVEGIFPQYMLSGSGKETKRIRSLTPRGFAMALYVANAG